MANQSATPNIGWQNKFSTTLSSGITASDTTIPLNSLPTPSEGFLVIEPDSSTTWEVIYYTSKTGSAVVCTSAANGRGVDDSTAQSHSAGATVRMDSTAGMFEVLQNGTAAVAGTQAYPDTVRTEYSFDYVASGLVWSGDSYGASLNGSMTSGVVYVNGQRMSISAVSAHAFTASKDTYVDILNTSGVGTIVYTEVANNAASPALAANSIRIAIVVSGANIAAATSINQGQETRVLPIASSVPYAVTDSLGNLICPRDPNRKILGYRQIVSASTNSTQADVTGLTVPVIVPSGRKIKISFSAYNASDTIATGSGNKTIFFMEGATQLSSIGPTTSLGSGFTTVVTGFVLSTPTAGLHTYKIQSASTTGTITINAATNAPASVMVELV